MKHRSEEALRLGIRKMCVSARFIGRFPRYVWARIDGQLFCARLTNSSQDYKGWRSLLHESIPDPKAENSIGISWKATSPAHPLPGRFLESALTDPEAVISALDDLVEATLLRLEPSSDPEVLEMRELREAVRRSRRTEAGLCERLAALGLDPYAERIEEGLVDLIRAIEFPQEEVLDLLQAAHNRPVDAEVQILKDLHEALPVGKAMNREHGPPLLPGKALPYHVGYARARWLREKLAIPHHQPVRDLEEVARQAIGARIECKWLPHRDSAIDALVHDNGVLRVAGLERGPHSRRFLLARALHHGEFVTTPSSPSRLLTHSHDWLQAASRAFAAEILVPAEALAARMGSSIWEDEQALAAEFEVSSMVIAHQLQNHGLLSS